MCRLLNPAVLHQRFSPSYHALRQDKVTCRARLRHIRQMPRLSPIWPVSLMFWPGTATNIRLRNAKTTRRWLKWCAIASATNAILDQLFQLVKHFHKIPASTNLAISAALADPTKIARSRTSFGSRKLYQTGLPVTRLRASICNAVLCSGGNSFT